MKLSKYIKQVNQGAAFTGNFEKNIHLKKRLLLWGAIIAIVGIIVAATSFILIGVFGADLFLIKKYTPLLISMFVLLIIFAIVFGCGLYILHCAQKIDVELKQKQ